MNLRDIVRRYQSVPHLGDLLGGGALTFALRLLAAVAAFGVNVLIARSLGPELAGLYFVSLSIVSIIALTARVGLPQLTVRLIAGFASEGKWAQVRAVVNRSLGLVASVSFVLSLGLVAARHVLETTIFQAPGLSRALLIMCAGIIPSALVLMYGQFLKAVKLSGQSVAVNIVYSPFIALLVLPFLLRRYELSGAAFGFVITSFASCLIGMMYWARFVKNRTSDDAEHPEWSLFRPALFLFAGGLMSLIIQRSPILFVSGFHAEAEAGVFAICNRVSMLLQFGLTAIMVISAPKFVVLFKQNKLGELEKLCRLCCLLLTLLSLLMLFPLVVFSRTILSIFGEGFSGGKDVLIILGLGQFINASAGLTMQLLVLTGQERASFLGLGFTAISCMLLCMLLVPRYGALGAAVSMSISLLAQNMIYVIMIRRLLSINPLWIGRCVQGRASGDEVAKP
jgi:O-antigen/teichoic acid export membrane protein